MATVETGVDEDEDGQSSLEELIAEEELRCDWVLLADLLEE